MEPKKYPLLEAREKTDNFEKLLLNKFSNKTLIVIRANIPGEKKGSIESQWIVYTIFLECKRIFLPAGIFHSYTEEEGLIFFLLTEKNALDVKRSAVKIEDTHALGRLADIDVLTKEKLFSRSDLPEISKTKNSKRNCFLCGKPAVICARNKAHSKYEIMNFINEKVYKAWHIKKNIKNTEYKYANLFDALAYITEASMLSELCRVYGFGCVTANGNGSHNDMDFLLMLNCIPLAGEMIRSIKPQDCASFSALRNYGKKFEEKLFSITNGVNTYKGAFFLLLILNACVYRIISAKKNWSELSAEIIAFSQEVKKDFYDKNCSKVSLNVFFKTGECGVRGEVLSGFKNHFTKYLPLLKNGENIKKIILNIISETYDTTIINRKGHLILNRLKEKSCAILSAFNSLTSENIEAHCAALSSWCEVNHISTGGTADKLIVLYFLYLAEKLLFN